MRSRALSVPEGLQCTWVISEIKFGIRRATITIPDPLGCWYQRGRATLCPEVNQHLWPPSHPGDSPRDGSLHSRHILPWRKGFGTCPHKATKTMTRRKPKSPTGSALERSPKSPILSFSLCTYNLLCSERRDDELRERLLIFPWIYTFDKPAQRPSLHKTAPNKLNYHHNGTLLGFIDCIA